MKANIIVSGADRSKALSSQDPTLAEARAKIARLGALLFDRKLTDAAGGNLSARVGDLICLTPRFAGGRKQWSLKPQDVLVVDQDGKVVEGEGEPSREAKVHLAALARIRSGGAMIHAHARHVLTFCALGRPIPPVLESGLKVGVVQLVEGAPAHSTELAEQIAQALARQEERVERYAAAVMAPGHGLFVLGRDLDAAFDAVERVNTNARCYLEMVGVLGSSEAVDRVATRTFSGVAVRGRLPAGDHKGSKPVLTVTPNTTIDRVMFIPEFGWGRTLRAESSAVSTGGKPEDVSYVLGQLGHPSLAFGFAAGVSGTQVESLLREKGVGTEFTWVGGESRVNCVIVCRDGRVQSTIAVDTLIVQPAHVRDLVRRTCKALPGAGCLVIGGTLPRGVNAELYGELIAEAQKRDVPTLLDSSGDGMRIGLAARPSIVKPNREELEEITGRRVATLDQAIQAARELAAGTGSIVVASLGEWGAVAVEPEGVWFAPPLKVEAVNTAGAGDGILAGLAMALSVGKPLVDGLRLGCALAAAIVIRPGTAECHPEDVDRFLPQVRIDRVM